MKQLVVLLLLWVVSIWPAMGVEHYSFYKVTQEADIMFPTRLSNIYEDSRGYIWLPTRSGLGKFDGLILAFFCCFQRDRDDMQFQKI